ncbi:MAG: DUF1631 family protein [Chromatiaceae bacterium]
MLHVDQAATRGGVRRPTRPPPSDDDRHLQLDRSLKVGPRLALESDRGHPQGSAPERAGRRVYLFTNRQGENALTLAATSLAEHLREGAARILSQERITDRAVAQLLGNIVPAK